jgi:hypothetical protein
MDLVLNSLNGVKNTVQLGLNLLKFNQSYCAGYGEVCRRGMRCAIPCFLYRSCRPAVASANMDKMKSEHRDGERMTVIKNVGKYNALCIFSRTLIVILILNSALSECSHGKLGREVPTL